MTDQCINKRILGNCLLISSLPGKASRTLDELRGLLSHQHLRSYGDGAKTKRVSTL